MWNYRIVRKKNIYCDPANKVERVNYTYAIHEAYYDNNGYVGSITQDPIEPFGDNIEELRHSWIMMAEAFGKPILDYGSIPEPGYEREKDLIGAELDERVEEMKSGTITGIPLEQVKRNLEEKWGAFDEDAYRKQVELERLDKEQYHNEAFIDIPVFEELIKKILSDYREYTERDMAESPWKMRLQKILLQPPEVSSQRSEASKSR